MTETKRCPRCERALPLDEFTRDRSRKGGLSPWCRDCKNASRREYYYANHDKVRRQQNEYRTREHLRTIGVAYPELQVPRWLRREYLQKFKSPKQIAAALGCTEATVRRALRACGIEILPRTLHAALRTGKQGVRS
ncbi:MAG: hypothetical protein WC277_12895 [Bacilli bacterium]|jgi:hypothetical protein